MKEFVKGLHHAGIPVKDMDATIKFYESLGASVYLSKEDMDDNEPIRVVIFEFGGVYIETYERKIAAGKEGAIDHLAFQVSNIDEMYRLAKEKCCHLMEECKTEIQPTTYWPGSIRWFIIIGPNGEKLEFCEG